MLEIDLSKNPKVKLKPKGSDIEFESKVLRYESDRVFLEITNNKTTENSSLIKEGMEVEMTICGSSRIVKLNSLVIDVLGYWEVCLELHDEYDVIQRRRYVRTKASYGIELKSDNFMFKAQTLNLGGGGVCFVGNHSFSIGQKFEFRLLLPEYNDIVGNGIIINKVEVDEDILIMFNFSEIEKETRNKIIRFCFEKEFKA